MALSIQGERCHKRGGAPPVGVGVVLDQALPRAHQHVRLSACGSALSQSSWTRPFGVVTSYSLVPAMPVRRGDGGPHVEAHVEVVRGVGLG